jgi:hypothetical protein
MAEHHRTAVGRVPGAFGGVATVQATGRFLRRQLWTWPIMAAVLFAGAGWWVHHAIENVMREQRISELNAMVDASATSVRVWMKEQRINVQLIAEDDQLQPLVTELLELADGSPNAERHLARAPAQESLRARLNPKLQVTGYVGYYVVSPDGIVLAADQDAPVGKALTDYRKEIFDQAVAGKSLVSRPFRSQLFLQDANGDLRANLPTMFTIGPLHGKNGRPIAALGLRIRPEDQFTRILQVVRFGKSGETYAFDRNGLMLSQSRFDDDLNSSAC